MLRASTSALSSSASAMSLSVTSMYSKRLAAVLRLAHRPLVLVKQRDGAHQREVLHVVAAGAGAVIGEARGARRRG